MRHDNDPILRHDNDPRQMTLFFHIPFESYLFRKLIFPFGFSKFIFMGSSPFGPVWAAKYLNFGGKNCEVRTLSFDSGYIHVEDGKKTGFTFSI